MVEIYILARLKVQKCILFDTYIWAKRFILKKYFSIICFFFFFLSIFYSFISPISGRTGRADQIIHGTVSTHLQFNSTNVIIDDNLTIGKGGWIEIMDSTLTVICSYNGSTNVQVESGGTLTVVNTKIRSNNPYAYLIRLNVDSNALLLNSEIRNCGYSCSTNSAPGISSSSKNLTISGCQIHVDGFGLFSSGSNIFKDTVFYPNHTYQGAKTAGIILSGTTTVQVEVENCTFLGASSETDQTLLGEINLHSDNSVHIQDSTIKQTTCIMNSCNIENSSLSGNIETEVLFASRDVIINNSTITNTCPDGAGLLLTSGNAEVYNSTISGGEKGAKIGLDPQIANFNLTNSSLNSYEFGNGFCHLRIKNFLNIQVISESTGTALSNTSIVLYNATNNVVFEGITSADGRIYFTPVLWKDITRDQSMVSTPHKILLKRGNVTKSAENIDMSRMQNLTIIFDDIPPSLDIIYPTEHLTTNSSILDIRGTTDPGARVTLNAQLINNVKGNISQVWWLEEGNNTLVFRATDPAGNIAEVVRNVTLKTVGPSIRISEPRDGTVTNQNPITIRGTTNGTRAEIDGNPVQLETDGSFSYNYSFPDDGQRSIVATAWDEVNNSGFARVRVEYDITPPSIDISSPSNGSRTNLEGVEVSGKIIGASNATLNGQDLQIGAEGIFSGTIQLVEGWNEIAIRAQDLAGNLNATSVSVFLDTKIQLDITSPSDGTLINTSSITIQGQTDPDAAIVIGNQSIENQAGNFSQTVQLAEGLNKVTVSSADLAGNRIEKTIRITVDTISPTITIISPLETTVKLQNLELRLRSESGAVVTVNGAPVDGAGDVFTFTGTLRKGGNRFIITARDAAGNVNTAEVIMTYVPPKKPESPVTIDNRLLLTIVIIIVVAVGAIIGYLYLRKKPDENPPPPPQNPV